MGFSVMPWGAEKLVPAEYWCPYGTAISAKSLPPLDLITINELTSFSYLVYESLHHQLLFLQTLA